MWFHERLLSSTNKNCHLFSLQKITMFMWYPTNFTNNQGYLTSEDVLAPPCLAVPPNAWSGSATVRDGFPFPWLVTSLSQLWSDMFAISRTILLQLSVLYTHRFVVSGFGLCLWCRLDHFRNTWRSSLSRCQTPRKNKQWIWQPRSTTTNLSAVIHLRTGFFNVFLYCCIL